MKLRFLSVALVLAVLSGAGYVAYTQIRPSADSVSTLVNSSDPALQCPDILPDMPSGSNSESGIMNGDPKLPFSISESWGPGHYEMTSKETHMIDDSNTATDDPKYYWTTYENTHIVSVSAPATVHPGQVFSMTSVTTDMTTFPDASEPTRTTTNTTNYTAYGFINGVQVVRAPETVWYKGKMSSPLLSDDKYSLTYIVTPSPPRDFTVNSDVPPFSFIGSTAPSVPFTFKSSLPSQLRLITHQAGLAVSPTEFLINDKDTNSAIVNGSSLTPGAVYVSGTAKEGCGGKTDAKATGYVYDLKALTENPTLNTSQVSSGGSEADQELETTELQIGLDGWTQLTTDDERAEFKKYFADKKWKVTLLGRNSDDEKYSLIPGTEAGVKDQARLTESGNDGGVVIPIQTDEWTTEQAGQTLQIRPTKLSIMNDMKLKLEIVGTEAIREFELEDSSMKVTGTILRTTPEESVVLEELDRADQPDEIPTEEEPGDIDSGKQTSFLQRTFEGIASSVSSSLSRGIRAAQAADEQTTAVAGRGTSRLYTKDNFYVAIDVEKVKPGKYFLDDFVYDHDLVTERDSAIYVNNQYQGTRSFVVDDDQNNGLLVTPGENARVLLALSVVDADKIKGKTVDFAFKAKLHFESATNAKGNFVKEVSVATKLTDPSGSLDISPREVQHLGENNSVEYVEGKTPIYPGDTIQYDVRFDVPIDSKEAEGQEIWVNYSSQTLLTNSKPEAAPLGQAYGFMWKLSELQHLSLESGLTSYRGSFALDVLSSVDQKQLELSIITTAYDAKEQRILGSPRTTTIPLWIKISGEIKTRDGDAWPYVTLAANRQSLAYQSGKVIPYSDRDKLQRTRTDSAGKYELSVPRKKLQLKLGDDGMTKLQIYLEYLDDYLPDGRQEHYDYRFVTDNNQAPVLVKSVLQNVPVNRDVTIDFNFTAVDQKSSNVFGSEYKKGDKPDTDALKKVVFGSTALRTISLAKHQVELQAEALGVPNGKNALGELRISSSGLDGETHYSGEEKHIEIAQSFWDSENFENAIRTSGLSDQKFTKYIIYHEWGHSYFGYYVLSDNREFEFDSNEKNVIENLGLPKVPNSLLKLNHRGYLNDSSMDTVKEAFAETAAVMMSREFDGKDDWIVYRNLRYSDWSNKQNRLIKWGKVSINSQYPDFAGLANGPSQIKSSAINAAPVVMYMDTELVSVASFYNAIITGKQGFTTKTAWWVGKDPLKELPKTIGGSNNTDRYFLLTKAIRDSVLTQKWPDGTSGAYVDFVSIVRRIGDSLGKGAADTLYRVFGLFVDSNCNFIYESELDEKLGMAGSDCSIIGVKGGLANVTEGRTDPSMATQFVIGPRPWRDSLMAKFYGGKVSQTQNTDSLAISMSADKQNLDDTIGVSYVPMVRVTASGADTGTVRIEVYIAGDDGSDQLSSSEELSISGTEEIPILLPPPTTRSRIVITMLGSSSEPVVIESTDYWQSQISDVPATILARASFLIDGAEARKFQLSQLRPVAADESLNAGECRVVDDELTECAINATNGDILTVPIVALVSTNGNAANVTDVLQPGECHIENGRVTECVASSALGQSPVAVKVDLPALTSVPTFAVSTPQAPSESLSSGDPLPENDNLTDNERKSNAPALDETMQLSQPAERVVTLPSIVDGAAAATITVRAGAVRPGDQLIMQTEHLISGETVRILIDDVVVAEDATITGIGAELRVTVPTNIRGGRHIVSVERITGEVVSATFQVDAKISWLWLILGAAMVGIGFGVFRLRRVRKGIALLVIIGGVILAVSSLSDYAVAANYAPVSHKQTIAETYIPPGLDGKDYANTNYIREVSTKRSWGTIGLTNLFLRLAGDWRKLYPEDLVKFIGSGIQGGGYFNDHHGIGHAQTRAFDFNIFDRATRSRYEILTDPLSLEDYNPKKVRQLNTLLHCLTNDHGFKDGTMVIFFAPKEGPEWAEQQGINYEDTVHRHHWHVEVTEQFQGPPINSDYCVEKARNIK